MARNGQKGRDEKGVARTRNSEPIEVRISAYKQGKHMGALGFPGFLTVMKREL